MSDDAVTVEREIAAPAEDLFDAWLDAESLSRWMTPYDTKESRVEADPRVGGTFRIEMVTPDAANVHTGTYREIDRPHRLVFTWSSQSTQFRDTVVTVTFEPRSTGSTLVQIHQVGLPDEAAQHSHHGGWTDILAHLDDTFSETRRET
jgi:uncharacterized protein YndB with AHSA1/START domain